MNKALEGLDKLISRRGFAYAMCMVQIEDETTAAANLAHRNIQERLSPNEIVFLWSLLVNKEDIWQYPESMDALYDMRCEVHDMMYKLQLSFYAGFAEHVNDKRDVKPEEYKPYHDGAMFQEAIFYSGGALYDEEYIHYIKTRYADDSLWLIDRKNYHADEFCDIALRIKQTIRGKIQQFGMLSLPETFDERLKYKPADMSVEDFEKELALSQFFYGLDDCVTLEEYCDRIRDAISFSREDLAGLEYTNEFLSIFSLFPSKDCNGSCKIPGDYSVLVSKPILGIFGGKFLLTLAIAIAFSHVVKYKVLPKVEPYLFNSTH